ISFNFLSALILTVLYAGLALIMISSPVNGFTPLRAARAGFLTTRIFNNPGMTNTPGPRDLTCDSISCVRQSKTPTTSLLLTLVTSVMVLITPLLERGSLKDGIFFAVTLAPALLPFPDFLFVLDVDFFTAMFVPQKSNKTLNKISFFKKFASVFS